MIIDRYGAFVVNSVGLGGDPFPLAFSVTETANCWRIQAAAASIAELADLLMSAMQPYTVVADLETNSYLDDDWQPWRPSAIAADRNVTCLTHPIGESLGPTVGLADELLVLDTADLARFVDGWSPYELTLLDLAAPASTDSLEELALAWGTADWESPVLPTLPGVRTWYSGHDNCYLTIETADSGMPAAVLARLLALKAGSLLLGDAEQIRVPDPSLNHVRELLQHPHWSGWRNPTATAELSSRCRPSIAPGDSPTTPTCPPPIPSDTPRPTAGVTPAGRRRPVGACERNSTGPENVGGGYDARLLTCSASGRERRATACSSVSRAPGFGPGGRRGSACHAGNGHQRHLAFQRRSRVCVGAVGRRGPYR
ncbi:hypothetical protein GCM10010201_34960 [Pilimelia columellifera subsp. columellifera]|uniref:Uncharacterized protein n=1 Tax=Pilimelia columellifera subsp. columellifera TaxID=706583 RepID=A0ABN3NS90_9ACTN